MLLIPLWVFLQHPYCFFSFFFSFIFFLVKVNCCLSTYIFSERNIIDCYSLLAQTQSSYPFDFFFFFGCVGSLLLHTGFLQLQQAGATLHCSAVSCCGAWALGMRASVVVACGLQSTGSVVVVHGLSCFTACGIFPDQGSNPCPLHWQADS